MKQVLIIGAGVGSIGYKLISSIDQHHEQVEFTAVTRSNGDLEYWQMIDSDVNHVQMDMFEFEGSKLQKRVQRREFDLIVMCVASHNYLPTHSITGTDTEDAWCTNLDLSIMLAQAATYADLPEGVHPKSVRLVYLSSDAAVKPMRNNMLYNMSKAALEMMVQVLHRECEGTNVQVGAVRPPHVRDTPLAAKLYKDIAWRTKISYDEARAKVIGSTPLHTQNALLEGMAHLMMLHLGAQQHQSMFVNKPVIDLSGISVHNEHLMGIVRL